MSSTCLKNKYGMKLVNKKDDIWIITGPGMGKFDDECDGEKVSTACFQSRYEASLVVDIANLAWKESRKALKKEKLNVEQKVDNIFRERSKYSSGIRRR